MSRVDWHDPHAESVGYNRAGLLRTSVTKSLAGELSQTAREGGIDEWD